MKKILLLVLMELFISRSYCQSGRAHRQQDSVQVQYNKVRAIVRSIKKEVSAIENFKDYKKEERSIMHLSAEGAQATRYSNTTPFKRTEVIFYGETGKSEHLFYTRNDSLICVKIKTDVYNLPVNASGPEIIKTVREVLYFKSDSPVRYEKNAKAQDADKLIAKGRDLLALYKKVRAEFNR